MQVTVSDISTVEKKVAVEIEWPYVAAKLDEAYRKLGRGVALKGFRKGKVPRGMLERMFGRQVERDVTQDLVQDGFLRAAQKHEIAPVSEPIVDEIHLHKGEPFRFSARVEVRAPFEPKDYFDIELERPKVEVKDEEVERALLRKRDELTEFKRIEGRDAIAESDVVFLDLEGEVGDKPVKREGVMVEVSPTMPAREPLPGLGRALVGVPLAAAGHDLSFTVEEPAPVTTEEGEAKVPAELKDLAGRTAHLKVTVKEVREKIVPALDDDLAKDTGEADTLAELRDKLREKLLKDKEAQADRSLRNELVKEIVRKNPFEVAPALVERQADALVHRTKLQLMMSGIDVRSMPLDEDKLKDSVRASAADEVRATFLLDAIATAEKVEVTEADLEKRLAEMAKAQQTSVSRLKADLQKEHRFESLKHSLREEKTLDLLMSRAKIK